MAIEIRQTSRKNIYPSSLGLRIMIKGNSLIEVCRKWLEISSKIDFPKVVGWNFDPFESPQIGSAEQAIATLEFQNKSNTPKKSIGFMLEGYINNCAHFFKEYREPHKDKNFWRCNTIFYLKKNPEQQVKYFTPRAAALCSEFARQKILVSAVLSRRAIGLICLPDVPIVGFNKHLVMTTDAEVEEYYERPEAFWDINWDSIEKYEEQYLLLRGMNFSDDLSLLSHIISDQWKLARAAKPNQTKYYIPKPLFVEVPILKSQGQYPSLTLTNYDSDSKIVTYNCCLEENAHICGWEIYEIREAIDIKKLDDGREVKAAKIIFENEETAQREKRPLLDVKAQVWYRNRQGQLQQLLELRPNWITIQLEDGTTIMANDAIRINQSNLEQGFPPRGNYLFESIFDSTAFQESQVIKYSRALDARNGKIVTKNGQKYDGLIYICYLERTAEIVNEYLIIETLHDKIYVGYYNSEGEKKWLSR